MMGKLRVKEILKQQGKSLGDLSEALQMHRVNLSRLLSDKSNPSLKSLTRIAQQLNVSVLDLFEQVKIKNELSGYLELNGQIYKISSKEDLLEVVKKLEKE